MSKSKDRRIYNKVERELIKRGEKAEAKVRWQERYHAASKSEQAKMTRGES